MTDSIRYFTSIERDANNSLNSLCSLVVNYSSKQKVRERLDNKHGNKQRQQKHCKFIIKIEIHIQNYNTKLLTIYYFFIGYGYICELKNKFI
jgi:hypothetical protein